MRSRFLENIGDLHWKILAPMRSLSGERHTQLTETKEVIKKNESTIKYMAWGQGRARQEGLTEAAAWTRMGTLVGSLAIPRIGRKGVFPLACKIKEKTEASAPRSWSGRGWKNHQNAKEELGPGGPAGGWKPVNTRGSADVFAATVTIGGARAALAGAAVTEGICLGVERRGTDLSENNVRRWEGESCLVKWLLPAELAKLGTCDQGPSWQFYGQGRWIAGGAAWTALAT